MGDREVYIKRMEAAVLQAGATISKLKAENAALKKDNEEFRAKIEAASRSKQAGTNGGTSSISIGLLPGAKILTIPTVKMNLANRKSVAMSGLEIGEGLVGITNDSPVIEDKKKELPAAIVNVGVKKISKPLPDIADIFLQAAATIREQSNDCTIATKRICRPLPDIEEHYSEPAAAAAKTVLFSTNVNVNVKRKISKPLPSNTEAFPEADSMVMESDTSPIKLTMPAVEKKVSKKLPEQGWETVFTAGSYSDKKFLGKQFQIKPTLKGAYSMETQKELLPNDTIQLLIANTDEKNVHSVAKSLRRFSPDIVSKHLMDHLRHIAYDPELHRDRNITRENMKQSDEFVDFNGLEKLHPEFIVRIDRLVFLIVSMYSKSPSDRPKGMYYLTIMCLVNCFIC